MNKLRSALTMLGIIIGVAAVIAMVAIGSGAQARIQEQIASIGSNVIIVLSGSITSSGIRMGSGFAMTLTEDDAKVIARDCPGVAAAAPASRGGVQVVYGNNNWATQLLGTTPDYLQIRDLQIQDGQAFTSADVDAAAKVALLGKTVVDNLFNGEDPVGQDHPHQVRPVHRGGNAGAQGPVAHRPGSGRHRSWFPSARRRRRSSAQARPTRPPSA